MSSSTSSGETGKATADLNANYADQGIRTAEMSRRAIQCTTRTRHLLKSTEIEHPMTRHPRRHIPSARKCLAVWRQCYAQQSLFRSYLPKNDAKRVLPYESRFSGSHGPSPLIVSLHTDTAALSTPIRSRSQGYDHHRRPDELHQEVQVSNVLQGARSGCQA
jgi:hypothetical protein